MVKKNLGRVVVVLLFLIVQLFIR